MRVYETALEAKVAARNAANETALQFWPMMLGALRPFVGTKILNQGGELSAKVRKALPDLSPGLPGGIVFQGYYDTGAGYMLRAIFRAYRWRFWPNMNRKADHQVANYQDVSIPLGTLDKGTLTELATPYALRTDFTADEIQAVRKQIQAAKQQVSDLQSELHGFDEFDR